jgi:hypothetical protein
VKNHLVGSSKFVKWISEIAGGSELRFGHLRGGLYRSDA